jgi:hypothetical protein
MSATQKYIRYAFALTGDRAAMPDPTQGDGTVSYQQGYGFDYQRPKTDAQAKNIERDKMNQVFYDLTLNQQQYQLNGVPEYVPAADNGGVAVAYAAGARVLYTDGFVYVSLVAGNNVVPGTDATKWKRSIYAGGLASVAATGNVPLSAVGGVLAINAAGATTQTLPAANTMAPGQPVRFHNVNAGTATVQRAGADTIQTNSGAVSAITLGAGDTLDLMSDGVSKWYAVGGSAALQFSASFAQSIGPNGRIALPGGLLLQYGSATVTSGTPLAVTYPLAYTTIANVRTIGSLTTPFSGGNVGYVNSQTVTGFTANATGSGSNAFTWWAVGN